MSTWHSESGSLTALGQRILKKAEELDGSSGGEEEVKRARRELVEATQELQVSVLSAPELLEQHQVNYQSLACLGWLVRFDIFNHVPADGTPVSYADLAAKAAVPLARLQSVARMAMTGGLFAEPSPTHMAHSRLSSSFAADSSLQDWARFMTTYSAPTAGGLGEASARWGDTTAKHETAFNAAFGTELPWFDYVRANEGLASLFAGYMRSMGRSEGGRLQHLVDGFDWAALGDACVVDVGGSTAQVAMALAAAFPRLHFVVQDRPEVVAAAGDPAGLGGLASRVRFVAHDFFTPQPTTPTDTTAPAPPTVPDIYLLRKILHDWPDARARGILQHLAVALRDGGNPRARLVVMDTILPPPGALGRVQEATLRVRDLTMAECFNSKERELAEWEHLFASTDPRLALKAWKQPTGSAMAVMEVGLEAHA